MVELPPDSFKPLSSVEVMVPHFTLVHDFGITRDFFAFFAPAMRFDAMKLVMGGSPADCSLQTDGPTKLYLVPRRGGTPTVVDAGRAFATHIVNAFQTARWTVVDAVAMPRLEDPPRGVPSVRMTRLAHRDGQLQTKELCRHLTEFPATAPDKQGRAYRYAYAASDPFGWTKIDTLSGRTWLCSCASGRPHLEPVFVSAPGALEEDEVIFTSTQIHNKKRKQIHPHSHRAGWSGLRSTSASWFCASPTRAPCSPRACSRRRGLAHSRCTAVSSESGNFAPELLKKFTKPKVQRS